MRLETEDGGTRRNVTLDELEETLSRWEPEAGFVILAQRDDAFMQAAGCAIEYAEGGRHFRHETATPDAALARRLLQAYFVGDEAWRAAVPWVDVSDSVMTPKRGMNASGVLIVGVLVVGVVGFFVWRLVS